MAQFKSLDDLDPRGKRVLVRVDFNVPMQDGEITDATRIERATATIKELMQAGAKTILLSHFGRPKGKVQPSMSLEAVAAALGEALGGKNVVFGQDCVGPDAAAAVAQLADGDVALLENLRFHSGEEKNDPAFAGALAELGNIYINDAFSCSHRAHASVTGIAERLDSFAGRLMQGELEALSKALGGGGLPAAALVGGAKISTKLAVIGNLLDRIDVLVIGGGMANTFLNAQGIDVGKSLCEPDLAETARDIMAKAKAQNVEIILPSDGVVAKEFMANAPSQTVNINDVARDDMILDIGPQTVAAIEHALQKCKILLWNGPMGAFEVEPFDQGTNAVAQAAAKMTSAGNLETVAGGGDTVAALVHAGVIDEFSYVSTAGGAFLEWLEGKTLPGVKALG